MHAAAPVSKAEAFVWMIQDAQFRIMVRSKEGIRCQIQNQRAILFWACGVHWQWLRRETMPAAISTAAPAAAAAAPTTRRTGYGTDRARFSGEPAQVRPGGKPGWPNQAFIVDVRQPDEYSKGFIERRQHSLAGTFQLRAMPPGSTW
jgi:hypothetical protein